MINFLSIDFHSSSFNSTGKVTINSLVSLRKHNLVYEYHRGLWPLTAAESNIGSVLCGRQAGSFRLIDVLLAVMQGVGRRLPVPSGINELPGNSKVFVNDSVFLLTSLGKKDIIR